MLTYQSKFRLTTSTIDARLTYTSEYGQVVLDDKALEKLGHCVTPQRHRNHAQNCHAYGHFRHQRPAVILSIIPHLPSLVGWPWRLQVVYVVGVLIGTQIPMPDLHKTVHSLMDAAAA